VNRVAQHPVQAFAAALAAVAVLSIMDAVMKHLVLAIGLFAVSLWRAVANLFFSSALYLPRRRQWPSRKTLWKYALYCGLGNSLKALSSHGETFGHMMLNADPD